MRGWQPCSVLQQQVSMIYELPWWPFRPTCLSARWSSWCVSLGLAFGGSCPVWAGGWARMSFRMLCLGRDMLGHQQQHSRTLSSWEGMGEEEVQAVITRNMLPLESYLALSTLCLDCRYQPDQAAWIAFQSTESPSPPGVTLVVPRGGLFVPCTVARVP